VLSIFEYSSFTLTEESLGMIGLIGGIAIIIFSVAQISSITKKREIIADIRNKRSRNRDEATSLLNRMASRIEGRPIIGGIFFSAMNPFFIIWWLTVGLKLIFDSIYYLGLLKVLLFYFHLIRGWIMPGWQLQHI
jgi:threonine/homoserine/homoserine lactone efflux protein